MVKYENHLGVIDISQAYFVSLVKSAMVSCYGVAGLSHSSRKETFLSKLFGKEPENKGVTVRVKEQKLVIDLHIIVSYGMNISAIVKSIAHKVHFAVEENTGFSVARVNVFVDGMTAQE